MADYHPLIARAVAGLEKNTGENRRALYERARTALVAQLRGVVPALDESEITRERLALEEAIRKVEAETARHAREMARPSFSRRLREPPRPEPHQAELPGVPPPPEPPPESYSAPPESAAPPPRRPTPGSFSAPRGPSSEHGGGPRPTRHAGESGPSTGAAAAGSGYRSLQDEALRGYRGVADGSGGPAASRPGAGRRQEHDWQELGSREPDPHESGLQGSGSEEPGRQGPGRQKPAWLTAGRSASEAGAGAGPEHGPEIKPSADAA